MRSLLALTRSVALALVVAYPCVWAGTASACSSEICPNDPSAVTIASGAEFFTSSIDGPVPDYTQNVFVSVWIKPTSSSSNLFFATGADTGEQGPLLLNLTTSTTQTQLTYIGVWRCDSDASYGYGTFMVSAPGVPVDGNWHNLIIDVVVAVKIDEATGAVSAQGGYAIDGATGDLTVTAPSGSFTGPPYPTALGVHTGAQSMVTWQLANSYTGDLAEFYLNFAPTDLNVSAFYSGGKAVGLGSNCSGPTGSAPNMCDRGDPCTFVLGQGSNGAMAYRLKYQSSQPLPNDADTEPCLISSHSGQGCPTQ